MSFHGYLDGSEIGEIVDSWRFRAGALALIPGENHKGDTPVHTNLDGRRWNAARLIARSSKIHTRFHRGHDGLTDRTPSGVDCSLACQLALRGLDPVLIESTLKASRQSAGLPLGRDSYYKATVGKALVFRRTATGKTA